MRQQPRTIAALVEAFLLQKRVGGCSERTVQVYRWWLDRVAADLPTVADLDTLSLTAFLSKVRARGVQPTTAHQCFRTLRTFVRWLVSMGLLKTNPLAPITMKVPNTLPHMPTEDELRAALRACPQTGDGKRLTAMILVMADSGLRSSEVRHVLVEHLDLGARTILVKMGKGQKDRPVPFSPTTARAIRTWLAAHPCLHMESFLFATPSGTVVDARDLIRSLHRASKRAGLPRHRWLHPHSLRHLAATSWVRAGVPLDVVRRLLGHSSLEMVLRYSHLAAVDVQHAHRQAGALEKMRLIG